MITAVAGGKGAQLGALSAAGFAVPAFVVLGADVLDAFLAHDDRRARIEASVPDADGATEESAEAVRSILTEGPLDDDTATAVAEAYREVGTEDVAVRSSAVGEDGPDHSFAGQGSTALHVRTLDDVARHVRESWASAWSARALTYRRLQGLPVHGIRSAVVIQAMVASEVSGVLFTVDPSGGAGMVVSAVHGLGEGLVSGLVDADTVTLDRTDGHVLTEHLGSQELRLEAGPAGGVVSRTTTTPEAPALTRDRLSELHRLALDVEALFGTPQDVEWAYAGGRLHVLQSRPVTTTPGPHRSATPPPPSPGLHLWDNANIVESFGEVTAPLTFSFAAHVYSAVYLDYCRVLGVPRRLLPRMRRYTDHMLGQFEGRVYYDVLNWYMVLRFVPLPSVQQKVLAATAGIREAPPEITQAQHPLGETPRLERLVLARTYAGFTWRFLTTGRTVRRFLQKFEAGYATAERQELGTMDAATAWAAYEHFERWTEQHWGPTAVTDAVISLSLGVLAGLTRKWLPDAPEWFLWAAVRVDDDTVESALPAQRLTELAARVRVDPALTELVTTPPSGVAGAVAASDLDGARWLREAAGTYLRDFGDRALNELKLEEPDLREDPSLFWANLRDAVLLPPAPATRAGRDAAEEWLAGRLRGPRRWVWQLVRRKVRATLLGRENVRFARSRAFALVRRRLNAVGADLARTGVLASPKDVHLLRLEELRGVMTGTADPAELRGLADLRRARQAEYRARPAPPSRFYTVGLPVTGPLVEDVESLDDVVATEGVLRGRPSCPGVVEAEAKVVDQPRDVSGAVLVAYRTDPGWVGALSSAAALLIERGSPLTHVAVVARELGIPTVVQIPGLTTTVRTGMRLRVDGAAGTVTILDDVVAPEVAA